MEARQNHNQIILPNDDIIFYADNTWENDRLHMLTFPTNSRGRMQMKQSDITCLICPQRWSVIHNWCKLERV